MSYDKVIEKRKELYEKYERLKNIKHSSYIREGSFRPTKDFKKYLKEVHNQKSYKLTLGKIYFARKKYKKYKKFMEACLEFHKYFIYYNEKEKSFYLKTDYQLNFMEKLTHCNNCGNKITDKTVFCIECEAVV